MEILRNPKSAETYSLFVKEMFWIGGIFLIAAILFFIFGFKYIKKRAEAELMQTTWQEAHPGTVAIRFLFFQNGQEKLWCPGNIKILKADDPKFNINQPIVSRDSEVYLIPGNYIITVVIESFKTQTIQKSFPQTMIGSRASCNVTLE